MIHCRNSIISLLLLFAQQGFSQVIKPYFNIVRGTSSFTLGKVGSIAQDKYGYMWFADQTNKCLARYDGYHMKIYQHDPRDSNSTECRYFECIAADASGNIWAGTPNGVDKFEFATNKFIHYHYPKGEKGSGADAIIFDHMGILWMGGGGGISSLDPATGKFTFYVHKDEDASSLSSNIVRSLYVDKAGVLWVGTGIAFDIHTKEGGLNRFNPATGTFKRYMHDPDNPQSLISNKVRAIFEDSKGNFWVGTDGDGLHLMNREKGTFERLSYDPAYPGKLSRPPVKKGQEYDHITFIAEDATDKLWIGTYSEGISVYDPRNKKIDHFNSDDKKRPGGYTDNTTWGIYISKDNEIWISDEHSDLFRVDPFQTGFSEVKLEAGGGPVHFLEDNSGNLWMTMNDEGLLMVNPKTNERKKFEHNANDSFSISSNSGTFIQQRADGQFWVGTWNGVNLFNPRTSRFKRYFYNPESKNQGQDTTGVFGLLETKDEIYFGAYTGLNIQNINTGAITHYANNPHDTNSISAGGVLSLVNKGDGNIWMSVYNGDSCTLELFNTVTKKFRHYLKGITIWDIYKSSDGKIWVGTSKGLYLRNDSLDSFFQMGQVGSEFRESRVKSMTEDEDKNIWGVSTLGIFRFNPNKNELKIYGDTFGTFDVGAQAYAPTYRTSNGEILFGNPHGYYKCFPHDVFNTLPPKIVITDFKINGLSVQPGKNGLNSALQDATSITLNYNQNKISIDFAAIQFSDPEKNTHQYTLERYDDEWRDVREEKAAYYYNIPPGQYTFRIKASSSYGVTSEKSIKIIVLPPWWQTWWFRISAIVLLAAVFYLLIRRWFSRKFKLQIERSEKEKQLVMLNQKTTELEMQALRAQMNPHFIFNSLNSINRFILQNNKAQASEYLTKFSKLVRMILQNSQAPLITLESELESLQLYLELEALRFDYHFSYAISVSKEIDADTLKLPPLIIQPYAENAIWHGLMHKEEKGNLTIEITQDNDYLFLKITDDGIGRQKAAAIASKSATRHKSMGLKITADRIAMIQRTNNGSSPVLINDPINPDGSAAGTEVIIKIPLIYD